MSSGEANDIEEMDRTYVFDTWSRQRNHSPTQIVDTHGATATTADGTELLDFGSQLVCTNLGYSADRVADAIAETARTTPYVNPHNTTTVRAQLGKKLADLTPGDLSKTFFSTSGTEANEAAIKIAKFVTGKNKILSRYRSYHGSTAGSMAASGHAFRTHPSGVNDTAHDFIHGPDAYAYGSTLDPMESLDYVDEMFTMEGDRVAAVIAEPVVGNHGVIVPPDDYLPRLQEIAHDHGALLILDEVMTGFGRTGEWFAAERFDVEPDIITMAKGLTGAYAPLAATTVSREVADYFENNMLCHGHTYAGHPLSCAAGLAAIQTYEEEGLIDRARELEPYVADALAELNDNHPSVGETRGVGLFHGIELTKKESERVPFGTRTGQLSNDRTIVADIGEYAAENGVALYTSYNTILAAPPLVITRDEIDRAVSVLDRALDLADQAME